MKFYLRFLLVWLLNSLVIWAANSIYPTSIVLGNANLSLMSAILLSGFLVTLLCKIAKELFVKVGHVKVTGRVMMFGFYWLINIIIVWLVARLAPYTGLGVSSYRWAISLAFALNFFQWVMRQVFRPFKLIAKK